eukprot:4959554-Pleurochrysis_carterae.AAC.3
MRRRRWSLLICAAETVWNIRAEAVATLEGALALFHRHTAGQNDGNGHHADLSRACRARTGHNLRTKYTTAHTLPHYLSEVKQNWLELSRLSLRPKESVLSIELFIRCGCVWAAALHKATCAVLASMLICRSRRGGGDRLAADTIGGAASTGLLVARPRPRRACKLQYGM